MPVIIDFDQAGEGFTALDDGKYPATISKTEVVPSRSNKANWNVNFEFALTDMNRKHWETRSLAQNALWRFKTELTNMGIEWPAGQLDLDQIKEWVQETFPPGMEVVLDMTQEDHWQGRIDPATKEVQKVNRATMVLEDDGEASSGW
jgi:hypothetical protein